MSRLPRVSKYVVILQVLIPDTKETNMSLFLTVLPSKTAQFLTIDTSFDLVFYHF